MAKQLVVLILIIVTIKGISQPVSGTTGLLNIPTAAMQEDGTIMSGANFLPTALTPSEWDYNTWNYFANITFLPFLELSYRLTLFKLDDSDKFNNQDRSIAARLRLLKERKKLPSIVVGVNDVFSSDIKITGSRFYSSLYLVGTKNLPIEQHTLQTTIGYSYGFTNEDSSSGIMAGLAYTPAFLPTLKLITEYDSKVFNAGASVLLFKHLYLYSMAHELKRFAGGFACMIYLNN